LNEDLSNEELRLIVPHAEDGNRCNGGENVRLGLLTVIFYSGKYPYPSTLSTPYSLLKILRSNKWPVNRKYKKI